MKPATPQRAALRLAWMLAAIVATLAMLAVAAYRVADRSAPEPPVVSLTPASAAPVWAPPPSFDATDPLTLADDSQAGAEPIDARPIEAAIEPAPPLPAAAEQVADVEHRPAIAVSPVGAEANPWVGLERQQSVPLHSDFGGLVIENPAALGPPDDDAPPPPQPQVAWRPSPQPAQAPAPPAQPFPFAQSAPMPPAPDAQLAAGPTEAPVGDAAPPEPAPAPARSASVAEAAPDQERREIAYTTSTNDLSRRLEPVVQAGFQLGKSGAVYAARSKFVEVLRRIAAAKDAEEGGDRHARALADGLRTLEDADDFVAHGDALEAEMDIAAIARSHTSGLLEPGEAISAHEAIGRYSRHAATRLAEAAANEPSGSMALYGLGKTYARMEAQADDASAGRKSAVMYRAATEAHGENYLAANELGVRLAREGHYEQARRVLLDAAQQPAAIATVHANLAAVERRLGYGRAAVAAESRSERLAQAERATGQVSRRHGVEWMAPDAFRRAAPAEAPPRAAEPTAAQPVAAHPVAAAPVGAAPAPPDTGGWTTWVKAAKRMTGWAPAPQQEAGPAATGPRLATPQRVVR
ncbi:hypothetical protein [Botrimarina sp.]|uniref:hypothetical protein n=1 Tax=Botrimarina sp. TaxID=2795802 RepID=UPI0032EC2B37